jgi:uncharacterized protein (DUF488 family)
MGRTIRTIGHSTHPGDRLRELLSAHGIRAVADVRAYPASRRHPQFAREALASSCDDCGIEYVWMPGLGGRRPRTAAPSRHGAWSEPGFRSYADYMDTAEFAQARGELESLAERLPTAFLCAEGLWWQCHRRLIADALTAAGWQVEHVLPNGTLAAHRLPDFARVVDGRPVYDRGVTPGLALR